MKLSEDWSRRTVAVLGGTGPQGRGLARRLAGIRVLLGSRDAERADATATALREALGLAPGQGRRDQQR